MANLKARVKEIAKPVVENLGYELVDVEYKNPGGSWRLTIYVFKPDGILMDDCELISRTLDPMLDEDESVVGRYDFLQVSSPGLDRPLKTKADYIRNINKKIDISLFVAVDNNKKFTGELISADDDKIIVSLNGKENEIDMKNIAKAVLSIEF